MSVSSTLSNKISLGIVSLQGLHYSIQQSFVCQSSSQWRSSVNIQLCSQNRTASYNLFGIIDIQLFQNKMIGVQEDLLNMFLVSHGLLLLTNLILGLLFFVFLCVRHNPAFKDNYRYLPSAAYNWFYSRGAQDPVYVEQPKRRRRLGIFGRN